MAPNGSYCSSCLLLAPIVSYCLLAALIVSYWLLMAPLAPVVSYWLLLVPIRSYWLLLALYFSKKENALPVHLLRQVFYGFHRFSRILIDLYGFHGFLGPELRHGPGGLLTNSPLVFARLVRRQDLRSQGAFSMDFIDFLGF